MSFNPDIEKLLAGILAGDKVMLARGITLIESQRPDHKNDKVRLLEACQPYAGNAIRIGITGPPGAGKSTLISALGHEILQNKHSLAVLAIDPSSEESKGSILGDKTRMDTLIHPSVFIRPSANNLELGGVKSSTRESILLCEAAGYDFIVIETVGVGQAEVEVAAMVDMLILVLTPAGGDELQGIKKGIMETADIIVINKSDQNLKTEAQKTKWLIQQSLKHQMPMRLEVSLLLISAIEQYNIDQLYQLITDKFTELKNTGKLKLLREIQDQDWLESGIKYAIMQKIFTDPIFVTKFQNIKNEIDFVHNSIPRAINNFTEMWKLILEQK